MRAPTCASLVPHPLAPDSGHTLMHNNVLQWSTCNAIINLRHNVMFLKVHCTRTHSVNGWSSGVTAMKDDILIPSFLLSLPGPGSFLSK